MLSKRTAVVTASLDSRSQTKLFHNSFLDKMKKTILSIRVDVKKKKGPEKTLKELRVFSTEKVKTQEHEILVLRQDCYMEGRLDLTSIAKSKI